MFAARRSDPRTLDDPAVAIARHVIAEFYPEELGLFDDIAGEWARRPDGVRARRLRAPVGMGVDLVTMTPVLLSVLSFVGAAVANHAVDETLTALSSRARERLEAVFRPQAPAVEQNERDRLETTAMLVTLLMRHGLHAAEAGEAAARIMAVIADRERGEHP
jgi:hypothetical protein